LIDLEKVTFKIFIGLKIKNCTRLFG